MSAQTSNVAIVVGRGSLPKELVLGLQSQGKKPLLVGIDGEFEPWLQSFEHEVFVWGQLGRFFKHLKNNDIEQVLFAGSMTRPKLRFRDIDWGGFLSLGQVLAFMVGGDNSLLTGVIKLFDNRGIEVIGAHEIMPELLAGGGVIAGGKPGKKAMRNIDKAFEACKKLGELDIGQGCVAVGERVVALEGIEGTDSMLERVAALRANGRLREAGKNGVLVKTIKPGQDMRVDLPAIGPQTIANAAAAGLLGIAVEAGHSIILDREETLEAARSLGVFIYGLETHGNES